MERIDYPEESSCVFWVTSCKGKRARKGCGLRNVWGWDVKVCYPPPSATPPPDDKLSKITSCWCYRYYNFIYHCLISSWILSLGLESVSSKQREEGCITQALAESPGKGSSWRSTSVNRFLEARDRSRLSAFVSISSYLRQMHVVRQCVRRRHTPRIYNRAL